MRKNDIMCIKTVNEFGSVPEVEKVYPKYENE